MSQTSMADSKQQHKFYQFYYSAPKWIFLAIICFSSVSLASTINEATLMASGIQPLETKASNFDETIKAPPANHKMEPEESLSSLLTDKSAKRAPGPRHNRQGRQYDSPIATSSAGSYASVSGDSAYAGQLPVSIPGSAYGAASPGVASNYMADMASNYHSAPGYPDHIGRGYQSGYPNQISPMSSMFPIGTPGGLISSSMFPLMSKGFDVSEIVCTAIAVAIGAVIVGAPFILIYLFIMNQMNGNGPNMGPSGGAISLTGPTSSTTVSGRKKRHTSLPEALFKQLSPLVNNEQVAHTFKVLMNSIAKYQM